MNEAARNVAVRCGRFVEGHWRDEDNYVTDADPGFVDAERLDFRLRDDSDVYRQLPGFEVISFEKIGLFKDEIRTRLPRDMHGDWESER